MEDKEVVKVVQDRKGLKMQKVIKIKFDKEFYKGVQKYFDEENDCNMRMRVDGNVRASCFAGDYGGLLYKCKLSYEDYVDCNKDMKLYKKWLEGNMRSCINEILERHYENSDDNDDVVYELEFED